MRFTPIRAHLAGVLLLAGLQTVTAALPPPGFVPDGAPVAHDKRQYIKNYALWEGNRLDYKDVRQLFVLNCWMVAATLAVSISSPSWVMSQINHANGTAMRGVAQPMAPDARVTVFDPRTLKPYHFVVSADDRELPQFGLKNEDRPGAPWWHAALTMALYRLGTTVPVVGIQSNGTINPAGGSAWQTLAALTGKEATYTLSAETTPDQFFQIAQKAYYTPIVVTTPSYRDVEPLDKSHGYAVMWATDYGNSTRTVTLRNPWGRTEEIELSAVRNATNYIGYLKGTPALGTSAARRARVVNGRRTGTRRTRMQ